jgi:cysteine sulfinate desulfinase/cysteine desulfurase-like protein
VVEDRRGRAKTTVCSSDSKFMAFDRGMRSGTLPHTLVIGLGAACEVAQEEMKVVDNCLKTEFNSKLIG